jgi:hypothetical protein
MIKYFQFPLNIYKVTGKRRETTTEERILVIENAGGKSDREIAEITGI